MYYGRRIILMDSTLFALFPLLLMLIVYVVMIGFSIWFAITLIKSQKERNAILKEISYKLEAKRD